MTRATAAVLYDAPAAPPFRASRPLSVTDIEVAEPGAGEALVRIEAAGLCHSDLSVIDGSRPRPLPMLLGHEACGIVVAVGVGVSRVRAGDKVVFTFVPSCGRCERCLAGAPYLCVPGQAANAAGLLLSGRSGFRDAHGAVIHHHVGVSAFATITLAHEASLIPIDRAVPSHEAALFGCALLTGLGAVINTADVKPGNSVAVFGLGGVGLTVVKGAVLSGAWPIVAVDVVAEKLELAQRMGATHLLMASDRTSSEIRELSDGGVDFAFEAAGHSAVLVEAYAACRPGATVVAIGLPHPSERFSVPAVSIVAEGRRIVGSYMGSAVPQRDIPRYLRLYKAGLLSVADLITATISLDGINEAFDALADGRAARQVLRF
jgi:Zn-dependent alcohol dehydrogenase